MESGKQLERLVFFSDAVFAIAITLLILDVRLPDGLSDGEIGPELFLLWPKLLGYVISFWVVGIYWRAHHRIFGYIKRLDNRLISLNLVFLMAIAFMPFPASIAGEYGATQMGGIFYACSLMVTGILMSSISYYVFRNDRLTETTLNDQEIRRGFVRGLSTPIVCLLVIALTFVIPENALLGFFAMAFVPNLITSITGRLGPTTLE